MKLKFHMIVLTTLVLSFSQFLTPITTLHLNPTKLEDFNNLIRSQNFAKVQPTRKYKLSMGYINDETHGDHQIYYDFAPCIKDPLSAPTIFWVNGGPGGAIMIFWQNLGGPVRLSRRKGFRFNKNSWMKFANLIMVDYPFGTGYSRLPENKDHTPLKNQHKSPHRFDTFMKRWFEKHTAYNKTDVWIGGDCGSGEFQPFFANEVQKDFLGYFSDRFKGVILEAGSINLLDIPKNMPIGYELYHIQTYRHIKKLEKKFKKLYLKKVNNVTFFKYFHIWNMMVSKLKRYPSMYSSFQSLQQMLSHTYPHEKFKYIDAGASVVDLINSDYRNFPGSEKMIKYFKAKDPGHKDLYELISNAAEDAWWKYGVTENYEKAYKKLIYSGLNVISYYSDFDACSPQYTYWEDYGKAMEYRDWQKWYTMKWNHNKKFGYSSKEWQNLKIGMFSNSQHALSWHQGAGVLNFVRDAVLKVKGKPIVPFKKLG